MKKKIIFLGLLLGIIGVKADMGAPSVVTQEVMIANKEGAYCYNIKYGIRLPVDRCCDSRE